MAKLTAKRRKKLPKSAFAYPRTRKYPINDRSHARNALARAAQKGTSGSYAHVAAAVRRKFPGMAVGGKKARGKSSTKARRRTTRRGTTSRRRRR